MFGLMKILRKENENTGERTALFDLYPGCMVGFGFIPQRNISGCRMTVKSVNSYMFNDDTFLTYVIGDGKNEINMIVNKDDDSGEMHLSLSQKIEERLFSILFLSEQPESWFSMTPGDKIQTSHRVMGMQQSWIASSYKLAMISEGSVMDGDYRQYKKPHDTYATRDFEYALLLDEDNEHALEAEKYADGTLIVYSTVYRPVTDIGAITRPSENIPRISTVSDYKPQVKTLEIFEKRAADVIRMNSDVDDAGKAENAKKPVNDLISIDAKLAGRVISEAQSNNISISELIRKVIDLPSDINDEVMITFSLSGEEQSELARRYHLNESDHEGVKKNIVEELQQFVGNKK